MIKKFAIALGVTTICGAIDPTYALPRSGIDRDFTSGITRKSSAKRHQLGTTERKQIRLARKKMRAERMAERRKARLARRSARAERMAELKRNKRYSARFKKLIERRELKMALLSKKRGLATQQKPETLAMAQVQRPLMPQAVTVNITPPVLSEEIRERPDNITPVQEVRAVLPPAKLATEVVSLKEEIDDIATNLTQIASKMVNTDLESTPLTVHMFKVHLMNVDSKIKDLKDGFERIKEESYHGLFPSYFPHKDSINLELQKDKFEALVLTSKDVSARMNVLEAYLENGNLDSDDLSNSKKRTENLKKELHEVMSNLDSIGTTMDSLTISSSTSQSKSSLGEWETSSQASSTSIHPVFEELVSSLDQLLDHVNNNEIQLEDISKNTLNNGSRRLTAALQGVAVEAVPLVHVDNYQEELRSLKTRLQGEPSAAALTAEGDTSPIMQWVNNMKNFCKYLLNLKS